jgi:hypothetical protein
MEPYGMGHTEETYLLKGCLPKSDVSNRLLTARMLTAGILTETLTTWILTCRILTGRTFTDRRFYLKEVSSRYLEMNLLMACIKHWPLVPFLLIPTSEDKVFGL